LFEPVESLDGLEKVPISEKLDAVVKQISWLLRTRLGNDQRGPTTQCQQQMTNEK